MEISAALVKELRDKTGAGMMDCKKALAETNGNMEEAIDYLRKKGAATAEKRADRSANEGTILTRIEGRKAAIVEVNCETDFVARSDDFQSFATLVLDTIMTQTPADVEALLGTAVNGRPLSDLLTDIIGKIGEKIQVKRFAVYETTGLLTDYIHGGSKIGVLLDITADGEISDADAVTAMGKNLCMQIAAMSPIAVDRNAVPKETQEKELEIYRQQAREQGKPDNMLDRIAEGRLGKFFQEFTLMEQAYIRDNTLTVQGYVEQVGGQMGRTLRIPRFVRFEIGQA